MLLLLMVTLCVAVTTGRADDDAPKIVKGSNIDISLFPYVVSIRSGDIHVCTGTAVNPLWVLTSANCIWFSSSHYSIRHSSSLLDNSTEEDKILVDKVVVHPEYNPSPIHDIALLRLASPIDIDQYATLPQRLLEDVVVPDTPATLLGWGQNDTTNEISNHLRMSTVLILTDRDCQRIHKHDKIHRSNICAGVPAGSPVQCNGDCGSPLILDGTQIGIASWSVAKCVVYPHPGVFTQISYYRDWIHAVSNA